MASRAQPQEDVEVVNAPRSAFGDAYHRLLRASWSLTLLVITLAVVAVNAVFGLLYMLVGGIAGARPGFADAFWFSVQTLGTIGYGSMYPVKGLTHVVVAAESIVALLVTALTTGLVFAKFSRPVARVRFTRNLVISRMDGVPTLSLRVANERGLLYEARAWLVMLRSERTAEGQQFWRTYDLPLVRQRTPALGRSWTVLHRIDPESPLRGATLESLRAAEAEFIITVSGADDVSVQTMMARWRWVTDDVLFDHRFVDLLSDLPDGRLQLDYAKFHDVIKV